MTSLRLRSRLAGVAAGSSPGGARPDRCRSAAGHEVPERSAERSVRVSSGWRGVGTLARPATPVPLGSRNSSRDGVPPRRGLTADSRPLSAPVYAVSPARQATTAKRWQRSSPTPSGRMAWYGNDWKGARETLVEDRITAYSPSVRFHSACSENRMVEPNDGGGGNRTRVHFLIGRRCGR